MLYFTMKKNKYNILDYKLLKKIVPFINLIKSFKDHSVIEYLSFSVYSKAGGLWFVT